MGISTSGNAENVMYAVAVAKASGIKTIGLTGKNGGRWREPATAPSWCLLMRHLKSRSCTFPSIIPCA